MPTVSSEWISVVFLENLFPCVDVCNRRWCLLLLISGPDMKGREGCRAVLRPIGASPGIPEWGPPMGREVSNIP
ncbi:hypothetical protein AZH53_08825 [Methanomicrobiaceae archaeon CYW5]|nr:hypothetical protein [Methanovulcanius yangii]